MQSTTEKEGKRKLNGTKNKLCNFFQFQCASIVYLLLLSLSN